MLYRSELNKEAVVSISRITASIYFGGIVIRLILFALKIIPLPIGDKPRDFYALAHLVFAGLVVAPLLEEAIFRQIPHWVYARIFRGQHKAFVITGCIASLAFAATHVPNSPVPITQFAFGMVAWHIIDKYGFRAAVFSHALFNLMGISVTALAFILGW